MEVRMSRQTLLISAVCSVSLAIGFTALAQQGAPAAGKAEGKKEAPAKVRPGLFFSEPWKQQSKLPYQAQLTPEHVSNPALELKIYGGAPGKENFLFTQHDAAEP